MDPTHDVKKKKHVLWPQIKDLFPQLINMWSHFINSLPFRKSGLNSTNLLPRFNKTKEQIITKWPPFTKKVDPNK